MITTAKTLGVQASPKIADLEGETFQNFTKPNKTWSNYPTSKHVSPFCEGLIHSIMNGKEPHTAKHVGDLEFEAECSAQVEPFLVDPSIEDTPIPKFSETLNVIVEKRSICRCSCRYHKGVGILCPHLAAVFCLLVPN